MRIFEGREQNMIEKHEKVQITIEYDVAYDTQEALEKLVRHAIPKHTENTTSGADRKSVV